MFASQTPGDKAMSGQATPCKWEDQGRPENPPYVALDLSTNGIFVDSEAQRILPKEAMQHPYFAQIRVRSTAWWNMNSCTALVSMPSICICTSHGSRLIFLYVALHCFGLGGKLGSWGCLILCAGTKPKGCWDGQGLGTPAERSAAVQTCGSDVQLCAAMQNHWWLKWNLMNHRILRCLTVRTNADSDWHWKRSDGKTWKNDMSGWLGTCFLFGTCPLCLVDFTLCSAWRFLFCGCASSVEEIAKLKQFALHTHSQRPSEERSHNIDHECIPRFLSFQSVVRALTRRTFTALSQTQRGSSLALASQCPSKAADFSKPTSIVPSEPVVS